MGDSSEEDHSDDAQWVPYENRPEWQDVQPIPQDDGDLPVVSIYYSAKFKDVYSYLRGIMRNNEKSQRALDLTTDAISLNAANYTVWQYRRDILKEIKADLTKERSYIDKVIHKYQKNYQVWHHRRVIVEWLNDSSEELKFTAGILALDAKNYHAWQHRQWAIKTFKLFEGELEYVDMLIQEDIRNNSAWNQRYFVINNATGFTEETIDREVEYTLEKVEIAKENESAWNYLRGLLLHDKGGLSKNVKVTQFCEDMYSSGERSPFLLALLVDMCDEQVTLGGGDSRYNLDRAKALCHELSTSVDKIRARYWDFMFRTIEKKAQGESPEAGSSKE